MFPLNLLRYISKSASFGFKNFGKGRHEWNIKLVLKLEFGQGN